MNCNTTINNNNNSRELKNPMDKYSTPDEEKTRACYIKTDQVTRLSSETFALNASGAVQFRNLPWAAPPLGMSGYNGWARLHDIYDGDTCTVIVPVNGLGPRRIHVRLEGINAPEMRSAIEQEKVEARKARAAFADMVCPGMSMLSSKEAKAFLFNKPTLVWLSCRANDKYGRVIAKVYPCMLDYTRAKEHVNMRLVKMGLARIFMPYADTFSEDDDKGEPEIDRHLIIA